jgi:hypothetical protein
MNGLYFTDGRSSRVTDTSGGLSSNTVYSLYIDEDGNIWTGTDSGLNIISDGIVYRVRNIEFLYHDSIYSIAPDGNGNIWLGSNKGLFKASLKEVLEKTLKNDNSFEFKRYSYADGMKSMECNGGFTPSYSFHDNLLYFPTLNGISVVNLKIDILNRTVPNLIIEKIFSEDTSGDLHNGNPVVFKPGSRKFEIKYTAPSFVNPQAIKFKYRLFGFDNDLVDAGNRRTAYYTNLKPGDYTFFVTASNNEGIWNKEGEKLDFSITPYFYQTWPFYAFIIILSVFSISLPIMGYSRKKIRTIEIEKIALEIQAIQGIRVTAEIPVTRVIQETPIIRMNAQMNAKTQHAATDFCGETAMSCVTTEMMTIQTHVQSANLQHAVTDMCSQERKSVTTAPEITATMRHVHLSVKTTYAEMANYSQEQRFATGIRLVHLLEKHM